MITYPSSGPSSLEEALDSLMQPGVFDTLLVGNQEDAAANPSHPVNGQVSRQTVKSESCSESTSNWNMDNRGSQHSAVTASPIEFRNAEFPKPQQIGRRERASVQFHPMGYRSHVLGLLYLKVQWDHTEAKEPAMFRRRATATDTCQTYVRISGPWI